MYDINFRPSSFRVTKSPLYFLNTLLLIYLIISVSSFEYNMSSRLPDIQSELECAIEGTVETRLAGQTAPRIPSRNLVAPLGIYYGHHKVFESAINKERILISISPAQDSGQVIEFKWGFKIRGTALKSCPCGRRLLLWSS